MTGGVNSKILVIPDVSFNESGVYVCLATTQSSVQIHTVMLIVTGLGAHTILILIALPYR